MVGYDSRTRNASLNLISKRFGEWNNHLHDQKKNIEILDGLEDQKLKLKMNGGFSQQDRMIFDKRRSLDRALLYSYQACDIKKVSSASDNNFNPRPLDEHCVCRCLINPDKNKMNYDDKIISVHFEENYHTGDVFEWIGTNSYWLIYLQDLEERAYFRGEIRRCDYEITWEDTDGLQKTRAAIRGPVETKIDYIQKHGISVDNPNHSLNILLPLTEKTVNYFKRYTKFYLPGDVRDEKVCWRVEAVDWISAPGVLEITAVEYYANETEDDIENGIVGGLKITKTEEDVNTKEDNYFISGPTFIKPKQVYQFQFKGMLTSKWDIDTNKYPVSYSINPKDGSQIKLIWDKAYSGQFEIKYGKYVKTVVVESLF